MDGMERRAAAIELRADGRRLEGYAAVFDERTAIADFTEAVARGAFSDTLKSGRDVLGLVDHDPHRLLGRTKNGTLRLAEDGRGLAFSIDAPGRHSWAKTCLPWPAAATWEGRVSDSEFRAAAIAGKAATARWSRSS